MGQTSFDIHRVNAFLEAVTGFVQKPKEISFLYRGGLEFNQIILDGGPHDVPAPVDTVVEAFGVELPVTKYAS